MRRPLTIILAFIGLLSVLQPAAAAESVRVSGTTLTLDGKPYIAEGAIFQVFVEPMKPLQACKATAEYCARHIEARDFYFGRGKYQGQSGLDIAKAWGMNTIRLNVSQAGLDPADPSYSEQYVGEIVEATQLARQRGFVVILALFDARNTNAPASLMEINPKTPLDNETTLAAAKVLAQKFGKDNGVMLEALNEPFSPTKRQRGWRLWRDGGELRKGKFAGIKFVGVNAVLKAIRDEGATNVVILQGMGANFRGFPGGVQDPLNQVAYSVHPFFKNGDPRHIDWDANFGNFAKTHPFLITAWGVTWATDWCDATGVDEPRKFLQYLNAKRIGLIVYALDVPTKLLDDFRKSRDKLTALGDDCADRGNIGKLVKDYFAGAPLAATP